MKFVKVLAIVALLPLSLEAQDDFIENEGSAPDMGGLFDEELEPLEPQPAPAAPERPSPQARAVEFPEAKKVTSNSGKRVSDLPAGAIPNSHEKLRMDFVQVEMEELVKYFAERLKKKFIYDPAGLQGKITIISPTEVTLQEAWGAFLSALEVRGYVVYPAGAYLKLEKAANARKSAVPVMDGVTPNDDSYVTRIITLKYLQANDIQTAVRTLLSRTGGDLIVHPPTNTLIVSDYAFNIRRVIRILNILDVEGFQEQIEIITLRNASAQDIAKKVSDFFPSGSSAAPSGPAARRRRGAESDGVIQKVVADERTNSLIVLGSERGIEQVRRFVTRIDVPTESGGGRIHVYPVQNVKAKDIAATLSALTAAKGTTSRFPTPMPNMPPMPGSAEPDVANLGDVKITADEATNSLVIQSSPRDFEILKSIIRKLDIRRRQVFIEGAILEASVSKGSSFGIQAAGPLAQTSALQRGTGPNSGIVGTLNGLGFDSLLTGAMRDPKMLTGMALGFRSGGNYEVNYRDSTGASKTMELPLLSAVLQLAAVNTGVNVLSTPHILATANEEASIIIGNEVPQLAGTETTTGGNVSRNITRMRVATELKIKPQINAGDYLTLKIDQKIDDAGEKFPDGNISTVKREVSTTVIIKDQQTVVIGGLMRDRKRTVVSKVPFLGDIPILGWLFKTRSTDTEKVNLILFLTPYIIRNTGDMNDQFFRKLKDREGFLKDIGIGEMKGVPSLGLTDVQKKLLDPEYVKSLDQSHVPAEAKTPVSDSDKDPLDSLLKNESEANSKTAPETAGEANSSLVPATSDSSTAPATSPEPAHEKIFVPRMSTPSSGSVSPAESFRPSPGSDVLDGMPPPLGLPPSPLDLPPPEGAEDFFIDTPPPGENP